MQPPLAGLNVFCHPPPPSPQRIVRHAVSELRVPISVKIRVFPDVADTIRYARRLEAAGASLVCVHGR